MSIQFRNLRLPLILVVLSSLQACVARAEDDDGATIVKEPRRTLEEIDRIWGKMPALNYTPPKDRGAHLPKTMRLLQDGDRLRITMLGDSIVNDTARSAWPLLLARAYPKCEIQMVTIVRGSTGCWWYKDEDRIRKLVIPQQPNLVIIGGISQQNDTEAIREVVRQIKEQTSSEVLLLTGAFGEVNPLETSWQVDPAADDYRTRLRQLAEELQVECLDMEGAWGAYVRESKQPLEGLKRDPIHANDRGEQILGRILAKFFLPVQN